MDPNPGRRLRVIRAPVAHLTSHLQLVEKENLIVFIVVAIVVVVFWLFAFALVLIRSMSAQDTTTTTATIKHIKNHLIMSIKRRTRAPKSEQR